MQIQSSTQEMIKELKEVKSVFNECERADYRPFDPVQEQQAQLDLAIALQMSLDIDWVISTFMQHMHAYLLFDGYSYQCESPDVSIENARQRGHSCAYNLDIEGTKLGRLTVYRGRRFVESERMLLENMLILLIHPLRNSLNHRVATQLAYTDALTGAHNRSTFDDSLEREMRLCQRHDQDLSVMVVDIDHFKKVNDTYGHGVGDRAIRAVADTIKACTRTTDLLFRYGGEEFVVFLTNTDCQSGADIAERIRESVHDIELGIEDDALELSVSIGLTCMNIQDTQESLFNRADEAMYHSKQNGRDQVSVA